MGYQANGFTGSLHWHTVNVRTIAVNGGNAVPARRRARHALRMTDAANRHWIYRTRPDDRLTPEHFEWRTAPRPRPAPGEVLVRVQALSVVPGLENAPQALIALLAGGNIDKMMVRVD